MHILFFLCCLLSPLVMARPMEINIPWQQISDPLRMSSKFIHHLESLPLSGKVKHEHRYWSGDYWPLNKGGINYRWNDTNPRGFGLVSPSFNEVLNLDQKEIATLAPSEKFDLLQGNYHYPLKREVSKITSPRRQEWEGLCHGWASAILFHDEPQPKIMTNPDGVKIPFGSSDIKALLSYYYAYKYRPQRTRQMGYRCSSGRRRTNRNCVEDMNAGAFHIVLANRVGLMGESFIADIERESEVWNHVPVKYDISILQDNLPPEGDSSPETVKTVHVRAEVQYVFNSEKNSWEPVIGGPEQKVKNKSYEYLLDVNKEGDIIGGKWISRARPDFLWLPDKATGLSGPWKVLRALLNDEEG